MCERGGGGSGGWSNFLSVLGVSNTFRTCVQRKQRFEKNAHNQTRRHTNRQQQKFKRVLHLPSWNFCLSCLLQNSALLSRVPAVEFCASLLPACCRILRFCLACLLCYSALLSHMPAAEFCTSVLHACCRILRKPNR